VHSCIDLFFVSTKSGYGSGILADDVSFSHYYSCISSFQKFYVM
jgi:hypothetical protein